MSDGRERFEPNESVAGGSNVAGEEPVTETVAETVVETEEATVGPVLVVRNERDEEGDGA